MLKVGIVAGPRRKTKGKGLADILFAKSTLYRYSAQYCRKNYDKFFVLTTKYGLISAMDTIESYNYPIKHMRSHEYTKWVDETVQKIYRDIPKGSSIYFHTGYNYRKDVIVKLSEDYKCFEPMEKMNIGQQLKFYKTDLGFDKEN